MHNAFGIGTCYYNTILCFNGHIILTIITVNDATTTTKTPFTTNLIKSLSSVVPSLLYSFTGERSVNNIYTQESDLPQRSHEI